MSIENIIEDTLNRDIEQETNTPIKKEYIAAVFRSSVGLLEEYDIQKKLEEHGFSQRSIRRIALDLEHIAEVFK